MGPDVWGITSMGTDGKPITCLSLDHVLRYDFAIWTRVADQTNKGMDLKVAFVEATNHEEMREMYFLTSVSADIQLPKCKAPGPGFEGGLCECLSSATGQAKGLGRQLR